MGAAKADDIVEERSLETAHGDTTPAFDGCATCQVALVLAFEFANVLVEEFGPPLIALGLCYASVQIPVLWPASPVICASALAFVEYYGALMDVLPPDADLFDLFPTEAWAAAACASLFSSCGDTTPPGVLLVSPQAGSTVAGTVAVTAAVGDASGIHYVEFDYSIDGGSWLDIPDPSYPNGVVTGSSQTVSVQLDTLSLGIQQTSSLRVRARAADTKGNVSEWRVISSPVSVSNLVALPTGITLSAAAAPTQVDPGQPISISGQATYDASTPAYPATVTVSAGGRSWTTPIQPSGAYSATITAPANDSSSNVSYSVEVEVWDGRLSTSASTSFVVRGTSSAGGYAWDRSTTCKDVQASDPWEPQIETQFFRASDARVYTWVKLTNLYVPVRLRFDWYVPSGGLYDSVITAWSSNPRDFGYDYWNWWKFWSSHTVAGTDWSDLPGRFRVKIYVDSGSGFVYRSTREFVLRYEFANHQMAADVQAASPFEPIGPTSSFFSDSPQALTWARLENVAESLSVRWEFFEPNGALYDSATYEVPDPGTSSSYGWYKLWGWTRILGYGAAGKTGKWHVRVRIRDAFGTFDEVYRDHFEIHERPQVSPSVVGSSSVSSVTEGGVVTLRLQATDNGYLNRAELHWRDASGSYSREWATPSSNSIDLSHVLNASVEGTLDFYGVAFDHDGNRSESARGAVHVQDSDTTGPAVSGPSLTEAGNNNGNGQFEVGEGIRITWSASDPAGIASSRLWIEDVEQVVSASYEGVVNGLAAGTYVGRIVVVDADTSGAPTLKEFGFTVLPFDNVKPTVTINQASVQSDPTNASPIVFTVLFSEAVTGFTGVDVSFTGSTVGGSLTASVTGSGASYTVSVTGMSGSGAVVASILAGAATDSAGNTSLASTSTDNTVTFDNGAPTVTINQAVGQADPTNASPIVFTVLFSEAVTGFTGSDVSFAGSTVGGSLTASVTGSGASYTVSVTGMSGSGTVVASIPAGAATDSTGNTSLASTSTDNTVTFDNGAPTVTINQAAGQADPTNSSPIVFAVVFSEPVTGFTGSDVSFAGSTVGGSLTASVAGSGASYTVSLTGMSGSGTVVASIPAGAATDSTGNTSLASTSTDNVVTFDNVRPTVTINQAAGQADPTNASPIVFTVLFSETVTGFTGGDVSLAGSTVGGSLTASVAGSGASYTVSVTGMSGSGTVVASIPAGAATDSTGNTSLASTSTDNTVTFDNGAPTVTINQASGQADPSNRSPIVFTVLFSEAVTGFTGSDVSFAGSTVGGSLSASVAGSGGSYTASVTGMSGSGTVVASIPAGAATDSAGNTSLASTSTDNTVTFDNGAPTVTINQAAGQADPTNASPIVFTVLFSEAVTGFTGSDVSFAGSTVGGLLSASVAGSGASYTVSVTGMSGSGAVVASIPAGAATDSTGNTSLASTSTDNTVSFDNAKPTVTINQASGQADPTNSSPILFAVVFSEPVTGFTGSDVSFGGSTVGGSLTASVAGSGASYTVSVTGMSGSGTVVASILAGAATDSAGNTSLASTSSDNSVSFDSGGLASFDPTLQAPRCVALGPICDSGDLLMGRAGLGPEPNQPNTINSSCADDAQGVFHSDESNDRLRISTVDGGAFAPGKLVKIEATVWAYSGDYWNDKLDLFYSANASNPSWTPIATFAASVGGAQVLSAQYTLPAGPVQAIRARFRYQGETSACGTQVYDDHDDLIFTVAPDSVAPTVTIDQAAGQVDPTNSSPILFTVVFSESVTGFTGSDMSFAGSTVGGSLSASVAGSGASYTVSVTGMSGSGTVVASILAGAATDSTGNTSLASTSTDNTVSFDNAKPTVTINQAAGQADPTNSSPILFAVVFSEPVTGFTGSDVSFAGSTVGSLSASVAGSGASYTVSVTGMSGSGAVVASIPAGAATDSTGNTSLASTSTDNTVSFDNAKPTVTINQAAGQADPTNSSPILFTVVFSEPVTGFTGSDVSFAGSTVGGLLSASVAGSGASYTVSVTGMSGSGTVVASIPAGAATDSTGNTSLASTGTDNSVSSHSPTASGSIIDYDKDNRSDLTVFNAPSGVWYLRNSSNGTVSAVGFGGPGYTLVPGDYDGDGITDLGAYYPPSGLWFIRNSTTGSITTTGFGGSAYKPVRGDFDGDGKTDLAVFHDPTGQWFIKKSSTGTVDTIAYGASGYVPVPGDYDGDGKTDLAVYHPPTGLWFTRASSTLATTTTGFGGMGYKPVRGDFDGDGKTDIAVYRESSGQWFITNSSNGATTMVGYGGPGFTPVPGRYDADSKTDIAVYHEPTGLWYMKSSLTGASTNIGFGGTGYSPVN